MKFNNLCNWKNVNHIGIVPNKASNMMEVRAFNHNGGNQVITAIPGNNLQNLDYALNIAYTLGANGPTPVYYRGFQIK